MRVVRWSRRLLVTFGILLLCQLTGLVATAHSPAARAYLHRLGLERLPAYLMPGIVIVITDRMGSSVLVGLLLGYAFLCSVVIVELLNVVAPPAQSKRRDMRDYPWADYLWAVCLGAGLAVTAVAWESILGLLVFPWPRTLSPFAWVMLVTAVGLILLALLAIVRVFQREPEADEKTIAAVKRGLPLSLFLVFTAAVNTVFCLHMHDYYGLLGSAMLLLLALPVILQYLRICTASGAKQ